MGIVSLEIFHSNSRSRPRGLYELNAGSCDNASKEVQGTLPDRCNYDCGNGLSLLFVYNDCNRVGLGVG